MHWSIGVATHLGHAVVIVAPVDQQQPLKKSESADRVVTGVNGLNALRARNADANVRRSDHVDIVRTVPNRECACSRYAITNEAHYACLLVWPRAATDDRDAGGGNIQQVRAQAWVRECNVEHVLVDNQCKWLA